MIALSEPNLAGNEWKYIKECLDTNWVSSVGKFVNQFESVVAEFCGTRYAVATSNGTTALHISLLLAGTQPGDLILAPNITFVASINAIKYVQADPVLIDVNGDTWQMNLDLAEEFLRKDCVLKENSCVHRRTGRIVRGILPVHVLGNICNMDRLMRLANEFRLFVVEDATESLGSTYKGKPAGSLGLMGCLSFNGNKIITTGGGGMIITNDETVEKQISLPRLRQTPMNIIKCRLQYRLVNILAAMGITKWTAHRLHQTQKRLPHPMMPRLEKVHWHSFPEIHQTLIVIIG
jgi:perosamine synthetase